MRSTSFPILLAILASALAADQCSHMKRDEDTAVCTLFHESTEGPYYLEGQEERQDITEGKPGLKLRLHLTVVNFTTCEALPNVAVDLWQCDALGVYSSFQQKRDENTFLRGVQHTNANGTVTFDTIYPGWYPGRTVHIHVDAWVNQEKHTGQFYFAEALTQLVANTEPYSLSTTPRLTNDRDGIYLGSYGNATTLTGNFYAGGLEASLLMGFVR